MYGDDRLLVFSDLWNAGWERRDGKWKHPQLHGDYTLDEATEITRTWTEDLYRRTDEGLPTV